MWYTAFLPCNKSYVNNSTVAIFHVILLCAIIIIIMKSYKNKRIFITTDSRAAPRGLEFFKTVFANLINLKLQTDDVNTGFQALKV